MNPTTKNIERLYRVIDNSVFMTTGALDYSRVTDATIKLANMLCNAETDETTWSIGEYGNCCLSDFIVGAYWHYSEWHSGQWSKGYEALSALGRIFSPGCTSIESERADESPAVFAYDELERMAAA